MYYSAKYFDGKSSRSHEVELGNFPAEKSLSFRFDGRSYSWRLDQCEFELVHKTLTISEVNLDAQLIVTHPELIKSLNTVRHKSPVSNLYDSLVEAGRAVHIGLLIFILGIILSINFLVLPAIAERSVFLIPESYDKVIGDAFFDQFIEEEAINYEQTELAQSFLDELEIEERRYFNVSVIESDQVNAFALPNGEMVIYTGIIAKMESYEELAALLAHETAHITNRHSIKMLCRNLASYLFISTVFSDVNSIMSVIADNANQLQSLSFSRELEHEADEDGIQMMINNQIDPKGMAKMFSRLNSEAEAYIPQFLSSHPVTDERIAFAKRRAEELEQEFSEQIRLKELFDQLKRTE
ncbi:MAG: M48 family metallopeptidase [Flavobacteriales bacterium]|nr:M48 family metallopeptidase [Flavobacteriales bacterium]